MDHSTDDCREIRSLKELCVEQCSQSFEWQPRFQHLPRLPEELVNTILAGVLRNVALPASHLVFFRDAASNLVLDGHDFDKNAAAALSSPASIEWCSQAVSFQHLTHLTFRNCARLRHEHLAPLSHPPSHLRHLHISNCARISVAALAHLPPTTPLLSLHLSTSTLTPRLPYPLCALTTLTSLHIPNHQALEDSALRALLPLTALRSLDISGSQATQATANALTVLSKLTALDVSWTLAQFPPPLPLLQTLSMNQVELGGAWEVAYATWCSARPCPQGNENPSESLLPELAELALVGCHFERQEGTCVGMDLLTYLVVDCARTLHHLELTSARPPATSLPDLLVAMKSLPCLSRLDLSGVHFPPLPTLAPLSGLSALTALHLSGVPDPHTLAHLAPLSQLPILQRLLIEELQASTNFDVMALLAIPRLLGLTLLLTGPRTANGNLLQAEDAYDGDEMFVDGTPQRGWGRASVLRQLRIEGATVDANAVLTQVAAGCPVLEELEVIGKGCSGRGLRAAAEIPALTKLAVNVPVLSQRLVDKLLAAPRLQWVAIEAGISGPVDTSVLDTLLRAREGGLGGIRVNGAEVGVEPKAHARAPLGPIRYPRQVLLSYRGTPGSAQGPLGTIPREIAVNVW